MSKKNQHKAQSASAPPSATAALTFLLVGLGGFYGLISAVDPLL
jgi:hypothetical protein